MGSNTGNTQWKMPETKLILLEGIPGSGKSTAGAYLQSSLERAGLPVRFWREGDFDNPADFEGVACLNHSQFRNLTARHPGLAGLLEEQLTVRGDDHLVKYRKLQELHPEQIPSRLIVELSGYDVYDGLPMQDYCRLALQRWQDFQTSAAQSDEITILECCFLQNPLTVMLARHNANPQSACEQVEKIARIIEPLTPLVLYLKPRRCTGCTPACPGAAFQGMGGFRYLVPDRAGLWRSSSPGGI